MQLDRFFCFIKTRWKLLILSAIIIYHFVISGLFIHTFKILPYEFRWLTDVAILILFSYSIIRSFFLKPDKQRFIIPNVYYLVLAFLIWCFITAVVNSINFFAVLLQFRDYARFIVFALVVVNLKLSDKDIKLLMFLILGIFLLQVPVTAIQCSLWTLGDWCVGTLSKGGTTDMVFLCCIAISLIISLYLYYTRKVLLLLLIPFFSLPIIFGLAYAGLFLYPYSILFTLLRHAKQNFKLVLFVFGVVLVFIATLFYLSPLFRSASKRYVSLLGIATRDQIVQNPRINAPPRIKAPIVAWEWLSDRHLGWLFGYGFGTTKKSPWLETTGEYAHENVPKNNQIATTLMETGFPGLFLFFSLFISLFVWSNNLVKKLQNFSKSVASVFACVASLMIIGTIYTNVLTGYHFSFIFWLMFAFLYTIDINVPNEKAK